MARLHALVAASVVGAALVATPARADVIALPNTRATLVLGAGWRAVEAAGLVAGYRSDGGLVLAITRAQVPNPEAWREKTREAYADGIERGLTARIPGYRRIARVLGQTNGVPTLDIEARRQDGATIVIRLLLFRTHALVLALEIPRAGDAATARSIAKTFGPPPAS